VGWCYSQYDGLLGLLCVLLVIVPDAKSYYSNKKRVVRGEYEHRGIAPQFGGTGQEMNSNGKIDCPVNPPPFDLTKGKYYGSGQNR
jgi:hypothetical protein